MCHVTLFQIFEIQGPLVIRGLLIYDFATVQKLPLPKNQSLNVILVFLFIRALVIRGLIFEERIYRE